MLRLGNVALLSLKQLKDSTISEVIIELDKVKELLTNSTRFVILVSTANLFSCCDSAFSPFRC